MSSSPEDHGGNGAPVCAAVTLRPRSAGLPKARQRKANSRLFISKQEPHGNLGTPRIRAVRKPSGGRADSDSGDRADNARACLIRRRVDYGVAHSIKRIKHFEIETQLRAFASAECLRQARIESIRFIDANALPRQKRNLVASAKAVKRACERLSGILSAGDKYRRCHILRGSRRLYQRQLPAVQHLIPEGISELPFRKSNDARDHQPVTLIENRCALL